MKCQKKQNNWDHKNSRAYQIVKSKQKTALQFGLARPCKNWKALVSTNTITSSEPCGNYAEITHNGDKKETYVDVYAKVSNRAIKDQDVIQHLDWQEQTAINHCKLL